MSALSFTKLFSSITDSSVWQESDETRLVWITMLSMADPLGRIHAAIPGLAHRARVSLGATEKALDLFLAPDPYSRSEDHDGRRIEKIQGGWRLLNYATYREMKDEEAKKERNRVYQAQFRKTNSKNSKTNRLTVRQSKTMSAQGEEEVEGEVEGEKNKDISKTSSSHPEASSGNPSPHPDLLIYQAYPRKEGRRAALTAIKKAVLRIVKGESPNPRMEKIDAQRFLMRRVLEYERSPVGRQSDTTKIPHPATWFNQARYNDDQLHWQQVLSEVVNAGTQSKGDAAVAVLQRRRNRSPFDGPFDGETGEDRGCGIRSLRSGSDEVRPDHNPRGDSGFVLEASR